MSRKSPPRVFLSQPFPEHRVCELPSEAAHHVVRVLRLAEGDALVVFDGEGREAPATITRALKGAVTVSLGPSVEVSRESPLDISLAQGISSGERMDLTIQKAVELGVRAIQPLATERSIVRLEGERAARRVAHWQAIAVAACEQCGRNRVPAVRPVLRLDAWLAGLAPGRRHVMLDPLAGTGLAALGRPEAGMVLLAGPEGGLAPREREMALGAGCAPVRLGPRVLRTETAALAAIAAAQSLWGDF